MEIEKIALNISKGKNGIYYSKINSSISYPKEGNARCMEIEQDSFWFNHRNDVIAEGVKKYCPNQVFFDIGGGNGFVSKRLQDEGISTVLIEPGEIGAINAHKRGIKKVICSTVEDAAFIPMSIDSVGLFDVVEHVEDDLSFLKSIYDYMKVGAYIFITVPAFNFLWSNEDTDAGHFRRYTTTDLIKLLRKSGFSIIQSTYIFSILPLPVFLFRTIPSKLGLNNKSNSFEKHKSEYKPKKGLSNERKFLFLFFAIICFGASINIAYFDLPHVAGRLSRFSDYLGMCILMPIFFKVVIGNKLEYVFLFLITVLAPILYSAAYYRVSWDIF